MKALEIRRCTTEISMRATDPAATSVEFNGYACVYDHWYDVAGGPDRGGWRELVAPGAGKRTLNTKPDVRLLLNHDGVALARTKSGTLLLEEDDQGLRCDAPALDLRNPTVQEVRSAMDRKDLDEMSFGFRTTRQEWNGDYTERVIREYALDIAGSDVSIVTFPANPATVAQMRSAVNIDELRSGTTTQSNRMSLAYAQAIAHRVKRG